MTCTSTDPLVATLFAIYARQFGEAIVILGERAAFERLSGPSNYGHEVEAAVNLLVSPIEFERRARWTLPVSQSVEVLDEIGFWGLPIGLVRPSDLRRSLEWTQAEGYRLNDYQIIQFNRRVVESSHGA
ncbi:MAG TPA: hypothetical protein VGH33_07445, partial [Isosphaeraceae bacterium]